MTIERLFTSRLLAALCIAALLLSLALPFADFESELGGDGRVEIKRAAAVGNLAVLDGVNTALSAAPQLTALAFVELKTELPQYLALRTTTAPRSPPL